MTAFPLLHSTSPKVGVIPPVSPASFHFSDGQKERNHFPEGFGKGLGNVETQHFSSLVLGTAQRACSVAGFVVTMPTDGDDAPTALYHEQWATEMVADGNQLEVIFVEESYDVVSKVWNRMKLGFLYA